MKVSSSSGRVCGGGGGGGEGRGGGGVCGNGGGDDHDPGSRGDGGGGGGAPNSNNSNSSGGGNNNNPPCGDGVVDGGGGGGVGGGGGGCVNGGCVNGEGLVAGVLVSDQGEVISDRYVGVARRQFASRQASERGSTKADQSDQSSGDEETTLKQMLVSSYMVDGLRSLQHQVTDMSANLTTRLDELQSRGVSPSPAAAYYGTEHRGHVETSVALSEIRSQLHELTRSLESCQSEVTEVKRDMVAIKNELDTVQQVKEEIEELREYVDRLELQSHRRKLRLLEQGLTFFLSYTILASMLGMLQFGYNTGVINAPEGNIEKFIKDVFEDRYKENMDNGQAELLYSFAVSIFAIGGMLGGFSGGIIANRFGRKGGLLLNSFVGIGGACLMGLTKYFNSYEVLFIGRFIIGVNCGLNTSLVPMYISEIAPLNLRGGLGTVNQLAVTAGLLISQILGIEQILGTDEGWPLLLGLAICPAILQLILLPVCPESPRYLLITKQWEEEARKALRRLRATNQIEEDIEEMRAEERAQQSEATISMMELVCSPTLRQPLIISVVMQLSQQLSGINAVFYYSTSLFITAGLAENVAKFVTIGIGVIMVNMTLVTMPLMDKTGRRTLHLYGLGGMFIFSIFITISLLITEMIDWMSYLAVVSILGFVVFFAVGPGSIPWMITAELFSQGPRPAAMSIAVLINWVANFAVGIGFQPLKTALVNYTFLPFSVLLAIFWIFTYKKVPETKNKTFEEILALFRQNGRGSVLESSRLYGPVEIDTNITTSTITLVRSMLNYSNALDEHLPPSERASLMVAEEKPLPDSSPVQHSPTDPEVCAVCVNTGSSLMMTSPNVTRRSSHTLSNHVCQMD